jgi:nucleoside-diphosphate-sugar epimerase
LLAAQFAAGEDRCCLPETCRCLQKGAYMARHAFILGGTGQIGRAMTGNLLASGWQVTIAHRGSQVLPDDFAGHGMKILTLDREAPGALARALDTGVDALIDITAYGPTHARQLLDLQHKVGAFVVISSASVYRDDKGRTLDEAAQNGFPELPDPIRETQPTVAPGPTTYSTRKVALERTLLDEAITPVTILRPAAIHGPGSVHPREWWFVKRILDRRKAIPLAYRGVSRFHTSSTANIAEVTRIALEAKGSRILNIADPSAVSVAEIAALITKHMRYSGRLAEVTRDEFPAKIGRTPWSVPRPFVLDTQAATALGYFPTTTYAQSIGPICDGLVEAAAGKDWRYIFPVLASYPYDLFDYALEDAFFAASE